MNRSVVDIVTEWDIVAARQLVRNEAKEIGFGTVDQARIATATSELARSIYLYTIAGEIIIERVTDGDRIGIRITAVEKGQTEMDVRKIMEDRFSNSGGLSAGLPGVKRLMGDLEVESVVGKGMIIKTEKWLK